MSTEYVNSLSLNTTFEQSLSVCSNVRAGQWTAFVNDVRRNDLFLHMIKPVMDKWSWTIPKSMIDLTNRNNNTQTTLAVITAVHF